MALAPRTCSGKQLPKDGTTWALGNMAVSQVDFFSGIILETLPRKQVHMLTRLSAGRAQPLQGGTWGTPGQAASAASPSPPQKPRTDGAAAAPLEGNPSPHPSQGS